MKCPDCRGSGAINAFWDGWRGDEPVGGFGPIPCTTCQGQGEVPEDLKVRRQIGRTLQLQRIRAERSLGQQARRLGLQVTQLAALERGVAYDQTIEVAQLERCAIAQPRDCRRLKDQTITLVPAATQPIKASPQKGTTMELKVGQAVLFIDQRREWHDALITAIWGEPYEGPDGRYVPCVNLLVVDHDERKSDQYGRQICRHTSVVHHTSQSAPGFCWLTADEREEAIVRFAELEKGIQR